MMKRLIMRLCYITTLGLIGAAIVHIAIILLVPGFASQSLWQKIEKLGSQEVFHPLVGADWNKRSDPLLRIAACRFDLSDGPVHISAIGKVPFWSLAVYNRDGDINFSINDQASPEADLLIVTPLQKILFEQAPPERLAQALLITQSAEEGIAVLRVFEPDATWGDEVTEFIKSAECMSTSLPG